MGYVVIESFVDMSDNNYEYRVGDKYPRCGTSIIPRRADELSGTKNALKRPLIRFTGDEPKVVPPKKKEVTNELAEPKKRGRKSKKKEQE